MDYGDAPVADISRRSVLRRAAVGGAVVWAAPVITSLSTPAHAEGSPACESATCTRITPEGAPALYLRCAPQAGQEGCPCACAGQPTGDPCASPDPCDIDFTCVLVAAC
jgi:hypothetical protein